MGVLIVLAYDGHVTVQTSRPLRGPGEVLIVMTASLLFSPQNQENVPSPTLKKRFFSK